jgi:hypothetical protein
VRPIYGASWRSGIRVRRVILPMLFILTRAMWRRVAAALSPSRRRAATPIAAQTADEQRWSSAS